jgi:3-oxoacyl-[acyl-carrier protein] reductase
MNQPPNTQWNFENKKVIITGGTRGIGRGITEAFLRAKAHCLVTYVRNDEDAHRFKEEQGEMSSRLELYKFDVSQKKEVDHFFKTIQEQHEQIHILVNNAGIRRDNLLCTMPEDDWHDVIQTNLTSVFYMNQAACLHFLSHRYGRIIHISSLSSTLGLPGQSNYAAAKAGLIGLTRSLSKEVAKKGITVNTLVPGFIDTEFFHDLSEEQKTHYKQSIPMKRFGSVKDVAHATCFLASGEASYITGSFLEISGGLHGVF